jgi:AcrR family transcriptional regulator
MADPAAPMGLRERKKLQTREALLRVARELFEARGYDQVTVAEIADAANISVKTLFTYFRSKEDLAFGDEEVLRDQLVDAVRLRAEGTSALDAVVAVLNVMADDEDEDGEGLVACHRGFGDSDALQSRLRRMWESYEDALAAALAEEIDERPVGPRARLAAGLLIAMFRSVTSQEVLTEVGRHRSPAARRKAWRAWIATSAEIVSHGLG